MVRCEIELPTNKLHFFSKCRRYLLLVRKLCVNKANYKQFLTCIVIRVDWYSKVLLNFNNISFTVSFVEWLKAPRWKARGRWFDFRWRYTFSFWILCLLPVAQNLAKPKQMKSSMTFIQRNGCIGIYSILHEY